MAAVVDPEGLDHIIDDQGPHPVPIPTSRGNDIGQIIFPLGVIAADILQRFEHVGGREHVEPGVDLADLV